MEPSDFGEEGAQLLQRFRRYAKSFVGEFAAARNRIEDLLGNRYYSGVFRESLLKDFLRRLVPDSLSVDSGFIYGFEVVEASRQLDIIIWDSHRHAPVYRSADFVVVPPESVVAVISVKSNLKAEDLENGLENLLSVSRIEMRYCEDRVSRDGTALLLPPIAKFLVAYRAPRNPEEALKTIAEFLANWLRAAREIRDPLVATLRELNPWEEKHDFRVARIFPRMVASIEGDWSCRVGYGPPVGPSSLRRLPYIYPQRTVVTSAFEKLISDVLRAAYGALGTRGWSTPSAWVDVSPVQGVRAGGVHETIDEKGLPLLELENLE